MKCGQIVLVQYPFTDDTGSKVRPALVVSADEFNRGEDFVVVPISSAPTPDDPHCFHISDHSPHFQQTKLRQTSSIKWTKPFTASRLVVRRRLGTLARGPLAEVRSMIQGLFDGQ